MQLKDEGGKVEFVVLDLEDLASVRRGAEELARFVLDSFLLPRLLRLLIWV